MAEEVNAQLNNTKILVFGDWLVDEYWLLGEQRSRFSRRRGQSHMLALHSPDASIRLLGGAGLVTSVLGQMQHGSSDSDSVSRFSIHGVGRWHSQDDFAIKHLANSAEHYQQTHHRVAFPEPQAAKALGNVEICNLNAPDDKSSGTTRIIRLFHQAGSHLELTQRIDWEVPIDHRPGVVDRQKEVLNGLPEDIAHVVVLDLNKGTVTSELISALSRRISNAAWYLFSKSFLPDWLQSGNENIRGRTRLLFVPQTAAKEARERDSNWTSSVWITSRHLASQDGIKTIATLQNDYPFANIVVAPENLRLLVAPSIKAWPPGDEAGRYRHHDSDQAYIQADTDIFEHGDLIPMATVLFPTLIGHLVAAIGNQIEDPFHEIVERSLSFTRHWMTKEAERFKNYQFLPRSQQVCQICFDANSASGRKSRTLFCDGQECKPVPIFRTLHPFSLQGSYKEWDSALDLDNRGIIEMKGYPNGVFQLWRSMTDVDGYVACVPHKRHVLQSLVRIIRDFKDQVRQQHTSVLLLDKPGSGKSYLVECLARTTSINRIEFNITQLLNRNDLLHCFDTIVTTQAQSPDSPLLVFFDEINANLDGRQVYDSFLAPLEQGIYERSGNRFHIRPCLWVFAGTDVPYYEVAHEGRGRSDKVSDFRSRLTFAPFDLTSGGPEEKGDDIIELEALERIYVAIAALRSVFRDVTKVSEAIFEILESLDEDMRPRAIRQLMREFRDVQRGEVTVKNLPDRWWQNTRLTKLQGKKLVAQWRKQVDQKFVEVEV